jgi:hypothetical protein
VCDPLYFFHMRLIDVNEGAVHISIVHQDSGQLCNIFIILCWADSLFYLPYTSEYHLRLLTQTTERERGIPIRKATPERGSVSPSGHHHSPTFPPVHFFVSGYIAIAFVKRLSTSNSSSRGVCIHRN